MVLYLTQVFSKKKKKNFRLCLLFLLYISQDLRRITHCFYIGYVCTAFLSFIIVINHISPCQLVTCFYLFF